MVFPAPAGVIRVRFRPVVTVYSFPRTCGGDPVTVSRISNFQLFSPHLRG